eukprot:gene14599-32424_t
MATPSLIGFATTVLATAPKPPPYCGPTSSGDVANEAWWEEMVAFRTKTMGQNFCNHSTGNIFEDNSWVSSQFVCPQSMVMDRYLYDPVAHQWTVPRFLADLEARYGGIDCVLLWQSYTNLGVDEKNQIDLLRVLPGGLVGLKAVVSEFHSLGVTVLFPWNHWGNTTGRIEPDADFVDLIAEVGADGFNEDSGGRSLIPGYNPNDQGKTASHGEDGTTFVRQGMRMGKVFNGHDLLDQPEHGAGCPVDNILGGWAGEGGGPGPGACIECAKFLEPRHTSEWVERHQTVRQPGLKWAFFNGLGYNTWENVWGSWNGISPRDGETMRRIFSILRAAAAANATSSCEYRPFYPGVKVLNTRKAASTTNSDDASTAVDLAATLFPGKEMVLLTAINQRVGPIGSYTVALNMTTHFTTTAAHRADARADGIAAATASSVLLNAASNDEYAAVVALKAAAALSSQFQLLLKKMHGLSNRTISSYSAAPGTAINSTFATNTMPKQRRDIGSRSTAPVASQVPMNFTFKWHTMISETHLEPVYPVPTASAHGANPAQMMAMGAFMLDKYPVTNQEFNTFLEETAYAPADPINFLHHWGDHKTNGTRAPTADQERTPVVFVSPADAAAYCTHRGARLPNEWEWNYAAQGGGPPRRWPWGNETRQECMPPSFNENGKSPTLPQIDAFDFLGCGSPFGVQLLTGSVWQWTNELADAHTRTALVKGGSSYWRIPTPLPAPGAHGKTETRSFYYFGNCAQETWDNFQHGGVTTVMPIECHGELYLMDSGYERASTVGFRWYGGGSSTAPACTWSDGMPDGVSGSTNVKSGLFTYTGTFLLNVTMPDSFQMKKLKVYAGIFCAAGELAVSMPGMTSASKVVQPPTTPVSACRALGAHATKNLVFTIYYTPSTNTDVLSVSWKPAAAAAATFPAEVLHGTVKHDTDEVGKMDKAGGEDEGGVGEDEEIGNITWQSATLDDAPAGVNCPKTAICIEDPTMDVTDVNLSAEGVLDWIHFGGLNSDPSPGTPTLPSPLYPERKKRSDPDGSYFVAGFAPLPLSSSDASAVGNHAKANGALPATKAAAAAAAGRTNTTTNNICPTYSKSFPDDGDEPDCAFPCGLAHPFFGGAAYKLTSQGSPPQPPTSVQAFSESMERAGGIMRKHGTVVDTEAAGSLHLSLQYLCCQSMEDAVKVEKVWNSMEWPLLNENSSNTLMEQYVSNVESKIAAAGVNLTVMRKSQQPFHSTLGAVHTNTTNYDIAAALDEINAVIKPGRWHSTPVLLKTPSFSTYPGDAVATLDPVV